MSSIMPNGSRTQTFAPTGVRSAFPQWPQAPTQQSQQPRPQQAQPQQPRTTQAGNFSAYSPSAAQPMGAAYNPQGNFAYAPPDQRPPPFQAYVTNWMGQPTTIGQNANQQAAMVQAINQWKAPHAAAFGQFGTPIPQVPMAELAQQANTMVQNGWTNPFAAQPTMPQDQGTPYGQMPSQDRMPVGGAAPRPSGRSAWESAGRPGFDRNGPALMVTGTASDGTRFGTQAEAASYDQWLKSQGGAAQPTVPPQPATQPRAPTMQEFGVFNPNDPSQWSQLPRYNRAMDAFLAKQGAVPPGQAQPTAPPSKGTPYGQPSTPPAAPQGQTGGLMASASDTARADAQMAQYGITRADYGDPNNRGFLEALYKDQTLNEQQRLQRFGDYKRGGSQYSPGQAQPAIPRYEGAPYGGGRQPQVYRYPGEDVDQYGRSIPAQGVDDAAEAINLFRQMSAGGGVDEGPSTRAFINRIRYDYFNTAGVDMKDFMAPENALAQKWLNSGKPLKEIVRGYADESRKAAADRYAEGIEWDRQQKEAALAERDRMNRIFRFTKANANPGVRPGRPPVRR